MKSWKEVEIEARTLDEVQARERWEHFLRGPDFATVVSWLLQVADECRAMAGHPMMASDAGKLAHACGAMFQMDQLLELLRSRWEGLPERKRG